MGSKRFSGLAILFCLVGTSLAWILGELWLAWNIQIPDYFRIGIYFGFAALLIGIMIFASQKVSPQLMGYRWKEQYFKASLKLLVPATLLLVGISAGILQMIYGLKINEPKTIKDIVIAVDRSKSMNDTDPNAERFNAISTFINYLKGDKRVALMTFNEHPTLTIDFTSVSNQSEKEDFNAQVQRLQIENDGQTGIRDVINEAYQLIEKGGKRASLILISDGAPTDGSDKNIQELVSQYIAHKIPIYTIGMMYTNSSEEAYLQEIARLTGGTYYSTSDTTMLNEAFGSIRYDEEKGTIVTPRTGAYTDSIFYKTLRILFLVIMNLLMALGIGIMFDNRYLVKGVLVGSTIGGIVGAIVLEQMFIRGWPSIIVRLIYWFIVGISLMSFTWSVTFREKYHGTREV